jgi:hypothetical protein
MTEHAKKNWEDLARAARDEEDSEKLILIVEELNRVLDEQSKPRPDPLTSMRLEELRLVQSI